MPLVYKIYEYQLFILCFLIPSLYLVRELNIAFTMKLYSACVLRFEKSDWARKGTRNLV